jgi:hypothetical protein
MNRRRTQITLITQVDTEKSASIRSNPRRLCAFAQALFTLTSKEAKILLKY